MAGLAGSGVGEVECRGARATALSAGAAGRRAAADGERELLEGAPLLVVVAGRRGLGRVLDAALAGRLPAI